jgi:hypothetical protein
VGVTPDERAVLENLVDSALDAVDATDGEMSALIAHASGPLVDAWVRYGAANGVPQAVAAAEQLLAELAAGTAPEALGPNDAELLCRLRKTVRAWGYVDQATSLACTSMLAAGLAAAVLGGPISVPILVAAADLCAGAYAAVSVVSAVLELLPEPGDYLVVEALPQTLGENELAEVRAFLPIFGQAKVCGAASGVATGALIDWVAKRAAHKLLFSGAVGQMLARAAIRFPYVFGPIEDTVASVLSGLIAQFPIEDWLSGLGTRWCSYLSNGQRIPLDNHAVLQPPSPAIGSLTLPLPGTTNPALYRYFTNPQVPTPLEGVEIPAVANVCGELVEGSVRIQAAGVPVTITMGDNGPALDDIFQVNVDGQVVLTSNVPVLSVQTTVNLAPGDHQLDMRGLAAPDGIGTYFIDVIGGQLLNGPPLSGWDLNAGSVFHWTLQVPAP